MEVAILAVGDPGRTRTVYAAIAFLVAIGVGLLVLAGWLVRSTRVDPEFLAPLELMGDRSWRSGDPVWQRRRLNEVIPNLAKPGNRSLWIRIEQRKRRLVYELKRQGLSVKPRRREGDGGLAFAFLEDQPGEQEFGDRINENRVLTGHVGGLITINIAEADDVERERRRVSLNEAQRTLLGHFRHESGHYFWDRLVAGTPLLAEVRACFGDEREDYAAALARYYDQGPAPDWSDSHVSAYASSHPWEDWAECWAHWLQINDALETAITIGLAPTEALTSNPAERVDHWIELALRINLLSRSLDQPDPYPYVLGPAVIDKLALVDRVIRSGRERAGPVGY